MSPEYLAGIIDGEGTVRVDVSNYVYRYPRIAVVNTHKPLLDAIQREFGGSVKTHDKNRVALHPNWSDAWAWTTAGKNAVVILNAVLPFLIVKREAAEAVLATTSGRVAA